MKKSTTVIIGGMLLWALPVYTQQHTHHEGATPAPSTSTQAPRTTPVAPAPAPTAGPTAPRTTPGPPSTPVAPNTVEPARPVVALPRSNTEYRLGAGDLVE